MLGLSNWKMEFYYRDGDAYGGDGRLGWGKHVRNRSLFELQVEMSNGAARHESGSEGESLVWG